MLFNSLEFAAFYSAVLLFFFAVQKWAWRKAIIILASYLYYGAWNPPYVLLLIGTTALDYGFAIKIETTANDRTRRLLVALSVCMNLGVLAFFKYVGFLTEAVNTFLKAAGTLTIPYASFDLLVPIGLSFYTFQSIAYVVDVYRREVPAVRSVADYMAFVSFFPLLAAGPIMRARDLVGQIAVPRPAPSIEKIGLATYLIVLGLFQKVVMADNIAPLVNLVFKTPAAFSTLDLWLAVYGFAFQIYFDFAGYSNMAMGVAALLGFNIPRNFNMPYIATGFSDFWRRWHISLSQWLRDYLYIPLGGNRASVARTIVNLMATMLLGGLWHGANWTFIIWGGLHGLYLAAERGLRFVAESRQVKLGRQAAAFSRFLQIALTFHLVCIAWVFFRAEGGAAEAVGILQRMVTPDYKSLSPSLAGQAPIVAAALTFLLAAWVTTAWTLPARTGPHIKAALAGVMAAALVLVPGNRNAFIYFQF